MRDDLFAQKRFILYHQNVQTRQQLRRHELILCLTAIRSATSKLVKQFFSRNQGGRAASFLAKPPPFNFSE